MIWTRKQNKDGTYWYVSMVDHGLSDTTDDFPTSSLPAAGWELCDAPPPSAPHVPSPEEIASTRIDTHMRLDTATKLSLSDPTDAAMADQVTKLQTLAASLAPVKK